MDVGALARATEGVATEVAGAAFHAPTGKDGQEPERTVGAGARPVIPTVAVRTAAGSHLVVTATWATEAYEGGVDVVAPEDATEG